MRKAPITHLVRTLAEADLAALCDRDLLGRFASQRDEAAFAAVVSRHQAMVEGVCRRALTNVHDAEDACQAVFLLLARKAGVIRWQPSVANWLYAAARKVAHNSRVAAARRARREVHAAAREAVNPDNSLSARELLQILDEELDRLASRYRAPLVLCCLEGLTQDEAATRLGVPHATLKSQLERGRRKLAEALAARGYSLSALLLAAAATSETQASLPKINALAAAALRSPSASAKALAREVVVKKLLVNVRWAVVAAVLLAAGAGGLTWLYRDSREPVPNDAPMPAEEKLPVLAKSDDKFSAAEKGRTFTGKVVGPDGKPVAGAKIYFCFWEREPEETPVRATTDEEGTFAFTLSERSIPKSANFPRLGDAVNMGTVIAKADGLAWAWDHFRRETTHVELKCAREAGPLTGRIVDLQGQPIAGVQVMPMGLSVPLPQDVEPLGAINKVSLFVGKRRIRTLPTATTDAEGRFRLDGFAERQVVELRLQGDGIETSEVYFLAGKHEKIPLPEGKSQPDKNGRPRAIMKANGDDYAVAPGIIVAGTVRDAASGKPIPGAMVETRTRQGADYDPSDPRIIRGATDADGRYRLAGLSRGVGWFIRFSGGIGEDNLPYVPTVIKVPEAKAFVLATVDAALARGVWIDLTTIDRATDKPLPGEITYYVVPDNKPGPKDNDGQKPVPDLRPLAERYGGNDWMIPVNQDGHLRLVATPDRAAIISFRANGGSFPTAVDQATRSLNVRRGFAHAFVDVHPTSGSGPLNVEIALDSSRRVKGKLVWPEGEPASVLAIGLNDDWYDHPSPVPKLGEFEVLGVEPGKPRLVCFHQPKQQLAAFVVVRGDEKEVIEVKLQPAATVKGRLLGPDGLPLKNVPLDMIEIPPRRRDQARRLDTVGLIVSRITQITGDGKVRVNETSPVPMTDDDGRFSISGLVPGLKHNLVWVELPVRGVNAEYKTGLKGLVFRDMIFKPGETKDLGDVRALPWSEVK